MENHYTIRQTAEILGVSIKTVRNRIARKEIPALWDDKGQGVSQWQIPITYLQVATSSCDVVASDSVPAPLETVTTVKLKQVFIDAIKEEVEPVRAEVAQLRAELDSQFRRQDERIRQAMQPPTEATRPLWKRVFGLA